MQDAARKNLEALKEESAEGWEDMKAGVDASMEDLRKSYDRARSRFR